MHEASRHEDAAFECVGPLPVQLAQHGAEKAVVGAWHFGPLVRQHEGTGAVSRLGFAGGEASLPDGGRLLVARHAANRDWRAEEIGRGEFARAIDHIRQGGERDTKQVEQTIVPVATIERIEQRTARITGIGNVALAVRQLPN